MTVARLGLRGFRVRGEVRGVRVVDVIVLKLRRLDTHALKTV